MAIVSAYHRPRLSRTDFRGRGSIGFTRANRRLSIAPKRPVLRNTIIAIGSANEIASSILHFVLRRQISLWGVKYCKSLAEARRWTEP